jgi:hypothetical protein
MTMETPSPWSYSFGHLRHAIANLRLETIAPIRDGNREQCRGQREPQPLKPQLFSLGQQPLQLVHYLFNLVLRHRWIKHVVANFVQQPTDCIFAWRDVAKVAFFSINLPFNSRLASAPFLATVPPSAQSAAFFSDTDPHTSPIAVSTPVSVCGDVILHRFQSDGAAPFSATARDWLLRWFVLLFILRTADAPIRSEGWVPRARGLEAAVPSFAFLRRPGLGRGPPQSSADKRPGRPSVPRSTAERRSGPIVWLSSPPPGER